jgi:hypothetical protein
MRDGRAQDEYPISQKGPAPTTIPLIGARIISSAVTKRAAVMHFICSADTQGLYFREVF